MDEELEFFDLDSISADVDFYNLVKEKVKNRLSEDYSIRRKLAKVLVER